MPFFTIHFLYKVRVLLTQIDIDMFNYMEILSQFLYRSSSPYNFAQSSRKVVIKKMGYSFISTYFIKESVKHCNYSKKCDFESNGF